MLPTIWNIIFRKSKFQSSVAQATINFVTNLSHTVYQFYTRSKIITKVKAFSNEVRFDYKLLLNNRSFDSCLVWD